MFFGLHEIIFPRKKQSCYVDNFTFMIIRTI